MTQSEKPLAGKRILVPPARPETNPLLRMLERNGAKVVSFPSLKVAPPADYHPMDQAIRELRKFNWLILSGSSCVVNFLARLTALGAGKTALRGAKIGAIGHGAVSALNKEGVALDYAPKIHTAEGVIAGLGDIVGSRLLLVRVEGASPTLPKSLRALGAEVMEVSGYRMVVEGNAGLAQEIFDGSLQVLALANPTAVRFLVKAIKSLNMDLRSCLKGVTIAAVGPATAEAARSHGLMPDVVSKGHIADLAETLTEHFGH